MLITPKKASAPPAQSPILGYNFSKGQSTSSPQTTGYTGGTITTLPITLTGYDKALRSQSAEIALTPPSAVNTIGTTDFTLEFWVDLVSLPTNYQTLFSIQYSNGFYLHMEFGDGGYGNRLYVGFDFRQNSTVFVTPFTSTATGNKNRWVHFAYVRQNRVAKVFIDGQQQQLAAGPFAQYDRTSFNGDYDLSGAITKMRLFGSFQGASHDIYMPEFALFNYAKYTTSFTKPTQGPIVT